MVQGEKYECWYIWASNRPQHNDVHTVRNRVVGHLNNSKYDLD